MGYTDLTNGSYADADEVMGNFALSLFGHGSDGAFAETTGDTAFTGGEIYQYTSFSLTGDATISYSGTTVAPTIILVQGDVTINTSGTCDFSGKVTSTPTYFTEYSVPGGGAVDYYVFTAKTNTDGSNAPYNEDIDMGIGGVPPTYNDMMRLIAPMGRISLPTLIQGGTKGGNGAGSGTPGTGGAGGAALYIICGGNMTITSGTFDFRGAAGTAGDATGTTDVSQGGGGGGGGSCYFGCAGTLSDSGTFQVTGGAGGAGSDNGVSGTEQGSGGGGASCVARGSDGRDSYKNAVSGGAGANGIAYRVQLK